MFHYVIIEVLNEIYQYCEQFIEMNYIAIHLRIGILELAKFLMVNKRVTLSHWSKFASLMDNKKQCVIELSFPLYSPTQISPDTFDADKLKSGVTKWNISRPGRKIIEHIIWETSDSCDVRGADDLRYQVARSVYNNFYLWYVTHSWECDPKSKLPECQR